MGLGANTRRFRYALVSSGGSSVTRIAFCETDEFTTTLILNGVANIEAPAPIPANTLSMLLPLASRGGSRHPAARVAVIRYTGARPPGLVTDRRSVAVLVVGRFDTYTVGQVGSYRGFPVELVQKIDGRPGRAGGF